MSQFSRKRFPLVMLSDARTSRLAASEGESKHPEEASFAMLCQGVSTKAFSGSLFTQAVPAIPRLGRALTLPPHHAQKARVNGGPGTCFVNRKSSVKERAHPFAPSAKDKRRSPCHPARAFPRGILMFCLRLTIYGICAAVAFFIATDRNVIGRKGGISENSRHAEKGCGRRSADPSFTDS